VESTTRPEGKRMKEGGKQVFRPFPGRIPGDITGDTAQSISITTAMYFMRRAHFATTILLHLNCKPRFPHSSPVDLIVSYVECSSFRRRPPRNIWRFSLNIISRRSLLHPAMHPRCIRAARFDRSRYPRLTGPALTRGVVARRNIRWRLRVERDVAFSFYARSESGGEPLESS